MTFTTDITVRFNHVDAAAIVFYPRYFEMLSEVIERWTNTGFDVTLYDLHVVQRIGLPLKAVTVDFIRASRLSDNLTFTLTVKSIGRTSATLEIVCMCGAEKRFVASMTIVHINLDRMAGEPWPADKLAVLRRFSAPDSAAPDRPS